MFFQFRNNTERRCRVCGSPEGVLSPSFQRGRICRKCMNAAEKVKSSERRSRQPKKETFLCRECGKTTRSPSRLCFRCQNKPKKKQENDNFMALAVKYNREHPFSRECLMNFLIAFQRMRNDCQPSGRCVERR